MNNIETVSTAARRTRQSFNSGQFTRTVLLTDKAGQALLDGELQLKRGQWVLDGRKGTRGQLVGVRQVQQVTKPSTFFSKAKTQSVAHVDIREYRPGRPFSDYQKGV